MSYRDALRRVSLRATGHNSLGTPFVVICSAQLVSQIGDAAYMIALPWAVFSVTGSFLYMGTVTAVMTIAKLCLASIGGTLADRLDRRALMIIADVTRGVALVVISLIFRGGHPSLFHLCLLAVLLGAADCVYSPAHFGLIPGLVPENSYQRANAIVTLIGQVSLLAGPIVAGFAMVRFGPTWLFAFDGLTFLVASILVGLVRPIVRVAPEPGSRIGFVQQLKQGLLPLTRSRRLQALVMPGFILNPVIDSTWAVCLPALIADVLRADARAYGTTMTAFGAGALLCALVLGRVQLRRLLPVAYLNSCVCSLCFVMIGLSPNTAALVVVGGLIGITVAVSRIATNTAMYRIVDSDYLGRVQGLTRSVAMALLPAAYIGAGYLGRAIPIRQVFILAAVIALVVRGVFFVLYRNAVLSRTDDDGA